MTLWLARHAQPLVAEGVCYGRLDIAADAQATLQCARRLAAALPPQVVVACSPLQRCEQLAQTLQGLRPDLAYKTDARLQEMDFGHWEGRPWQALPEAELQAWTDDFAHYRAGAVGENVSRFMARVGAAFDALPAAGEAGPDTLWITHAGVIRAVDLLTRGLRQIERAEQWPREAPKYGQWHTQKRSPEPASASARHPGP